MRMRTSKQSLLGFVLVAALLVTGCASTDKPAGPPKTGNEAYDNVLQRVYDKHPDEPWWGEINRATYRLGTLKLQTDYQLAEPDDLIAATLLCRAILLEIAPSGVSAGVWIEGNLLRGRRQADGSIATREDNWTAASGRTGKRGEPPYCVANALLPNVWDPLESQGWVSSASIEGIRDADERRAKLTSLNLHSGRSRFFDGEQLEDGTWVWFGR